MQAGGSGKDRGPFGHDWPVILAVMKTGRVEAHDFAAVGHLPYTVSLDQRRAEHAVQGPIIYQARGEPFRRELPKKLAVGDRVAVMATKAPDGSLTSDKAVSTAK